MAEILVNEVDGVATLGAAVVTAPASGTSETWTFTTLPAALQLGTFRAKQSGGSSTDELVKITPLSSTSATVVRGIEGTTPATHINGTVFVPIVTVAGIEQRINDLIASGSVYREEFTPSAAATTVVLAHTPSIIISVTRNGIEQSAGAGHFSLSTATLIFTTAFVSGDRVIVVYAAGGINGVDTSQLLLTTDARLSYMLLQARYR